MGASTAIERVDPRDPNHSILFAEHIVRYIFGSSFVSEKRVLDVGCGEGYGAATLQIAGADTVIAIDLDHTAVRNAQRQYDRDHLHFLTGSASHLPCPDHSIDVVVCFEVLEHLSESDQRAFLDEAGRVLDANGTLIVSTPNTEIYAPRVSATILGVNPYHLHEQTYEQFACILTDTFANVEIVGQTPIPAEIVPVTDISPSSIRYHAIGDLVYAVQIRDGEVSVSARLAIPPLPQLSPYMIAVCHNGCSTATSLPHRDIETLANSLADLVVFPLWARWGAHYQPVLDRLITDNHQLKQTVEERTAWAQAQGRELEQARAVIEELQHLVEERTAWAQAQGRELEQARAVIEELQQVS